MDGPSDEHELVLRARLDSQAPDIDSMVYLTDCDPGDIPTGTFIEADIVGSRGYDLVARPLAPPGAGVHGGDQSLGIPASV